MYLLISFQYPFRLGYHGWMFWVAIFLNYGITAVKLHHFEIIEIAFRLDFYSWTNGYHLWFWSQEPNVHCLSRGSKQANTFQTVASDTKAYTWARDNTSCRRKKRVAKNPAATFELKRSTRTVTKTSWTTTHPEPQNRPFHLEPQDRLHPMWMAINC